MKSHWYDRKISRILVDMHIPDWRKDFMAKFSPEEYARYMKQSGAQVVEISSRSCLGLCYWPTRIGTPHANVGERDILGLTVAACRKLDLPVVIYMNVWARCTYDQHPDWRVQVLHNSGNLERMGICCPNSPYQQFFLSLLDEMNSRYDCDGLWIDMIGWFRQVCYCPHCQKRFEQETGYPELPQLVDWDNPVWVAFQKHRIGWMTEFAANIRRTVKERTPERSVAMQSTSCRWAWRGGADAEFFQQSDYLAGDLYIDQYQQSFFRKMFNSFTRHRPIEFMITRCESLHAHTTNKTRDDLELRSCASIANQSAFTLIDAIDPAGSLKPDFYQKAAWLNEKLNQFSNLVSPDTVSLAEVAVYYQPEAVVDTGIPPRPVKDFPYEVQEIKRYYYLARILQEHHLLFDVIGKRHLDQLRKYRLIVLPECAFLSAAECDALRQYVADGGKIYASGATSLYDMESARLPDFRLADVLGVHFDGGFSERVNYLSPTTDFLDAEDDIMLNFRQVHITADQDCEILCRRTEAVSQPEECTYFGSALSSPPEKPGTAAAMVRHHYGDGEAIYCAGSIEYENFNSHRQLLGTLFRQMLCDDTLIKSDAYCGVEFTIFDDPARHRLLISLLHFINVCPPVLRNIQVKFRLPEEWQVKTLRVEPEGKELPFTLDDTNHVIFDVAVLDKFIMLSLERL